MEAEPSSSVADLLSGALFERLVQSWQRLGRLAYGEGGPPDDSLMRAHAIKYMTRYLTAGSILAIELGDPDYPYFERWADRAWSWGIDNPDGIYQFASVGGAHTYRITGSRGTARQFDVQVHAPHFCNSPDYEIVANINFETLDVADDGTVEIILSPHPHDGNWLRSTSEVGSLCVRQFFYDWENEQPADLRIERVGASYPPPPERPERTVEQIELLMAWLDQAATFWDRMAHWCLDNPPNSSPFLAPDLSEWGGHRGLSYGMGNYRCEPDEAVILEVTPPDCHYWGFQLGTWFWESMDWWRRQTSLNGHQAVLDDDGVFRCVIAHHDPGVPNWLDTAGYTWGTLNGRWLITADWPEPEMTVVPLTDVDRHLPDRTSRVSPAERSESLRRRERAAQRLGGF